MTDQELETIIAGDEGEQTEFKIESEKPSDLAEVLQGFAHAQGGRLLVGVSDDGQVVGVTRLKYVIDRLRQAAAQVSPSLEPFLSIETVNIQGQQVVVAQIPQVDGIFAVSGGYRIRKGSRTVAMTLEELRSRMAHFGQIVTENLPVPTASLDDIDQEAFRAYLQQRSTRPEGPDDLTNLLRRESFLTLDGPTERPTYAAMLLFGKAPQDFGPLFNARLKAARFAGTEPVYFLDEANFTGTIPAIIKEAIAFVGRNIHHPLLVDPAITGTYTSVKTSEYPEAAFREALTNALCHRDYYLSRPSYLKIFDDRIEIESPGGLYGATGIEEIKGRHLTRNATIARTLHVLGLIEQFGTGLYRMERTMREAGLPPPLFQYSEQHFLVTLRGPSSLTDARSRPPTDAPAERAGPGETAEEKELTWLLERIGGNERLQPRRVRQARGTLYARNRGSISRSQYVELNDLSEDTAKIDLRELVQEGVLELSGAARASVYRLMDYKPRS